MYYYSLLYPYSLFIYNYYSIIPYSALNKRVLKAYAAFLDVFDRAGAHKRVLKAYAAFLDVFDRAGAHKRVLKAYAALP